MIKYPGEETESDLFSDIIITDIENDQSDTEEMVTIDISMGSSRKTRLQNYLARHKIENRQERRRLRNLLEEF